MLWRCTKRPDDVDSDAARKGAMPRAEATSWCVWWEVGLTSRIDLGTLGATVGSDENYSGLSVGSDENYSGLSVGSDENYAGLSVGSH